MNQNPLVATDTQGRGVNKTDTDADSWVIKV